MNNTLETNDSTIDYNELSEIYDNNPFEKYETFSYEDPKKEDLILDIVKESDWDSEVPRIINNITQNKLTQRYYDDYPYFKTDKQKEDLIVHLSEKSNIINDAQLNEIAQVIPYYLRNVKYNLVFRLKRDGSSLKTFYHLAKGLNNTLLVVKDDEGNIFGGFNCEDYSLGKKGFYGRGENFLFTFYKENTVHVFYATGENDNFVYCDENRIALGCSDDYFGLTLKNDFLEGYSKKVSTFDNSVLNGKNEEFYIIDVELWVLGDL